MSTNSASNKAFKNFKKSLRRAINNIDITLKNRKVVMEGLAKALLLPDEMVLFKSVLDTYKRYAYEFDIAKEALINAYDRMGIAKFLELAVMDNENLEKDKELYQSFKDAFGINGAIKFNDYISNLIFMLESLVRNDLLTMQEACILIGSQVAYNKDNMPDGANETFIYVNNSLASYFNIDGSFTIKGDLTNLRRSLIIFASPIIESANNPKKIGYIIKFVEAICCEYKEFLLEYEREQNKEKIEDTSMPLKKEIIEIKREDLEELKKYYKNGEVINVPHDIQEFKSLLNRTGIDKQEYSFIMNQIKVKNKLAIYPFLEPSEKELVIYAKKVLNEMNQTNELYPKLVKILKDFDVLNELYNEGFDNEYIDIKDELIYALQNIMMMLNDFTATIDSDDKNILYYSTNNTSDASKCYFVNDLLGLRAEAYETILSLMNDFKNGILTSVKYLKDSSGCFELKKDQIRIILKQIEDNKYAVYGLFIKKSNNNMHKYREIFKRPSAYISLGYSKEVEDFYQKYIIDNQRKGSRC